MRTLQQIIDVYCELIIITFLEEFVHHVLEVVTGSSIGNRRSRRFYLRKVPLESVYLRLHLSYGRPVRRRPALVHLAAQLSKVASLLQRRRTMHIQDRKAEEVYEERDLCT